MKAEKCPGSKCEYWGVAVRYKYGTTVFGCRFRFADNRFDGIGFKKNTQNNLCDLYKPKEASHEEKRN